MKFRLLSLLLSCSLSRCSSVKLRLLSLFRSCSLSRCSFVKLRLLSVLLSCSLSRSSSVKLRLLSLFLSCSLSRCSSVKLCLLSLFLPCSLSRCSSEQFRLLSLALCRSLSRWAWLACRLLSRFLCLSLSLYSKLEDIINKIQELRNCAVLNRYEKFLFLLSWLRWSFQLFMLHETRAALCFRAKNYMHSQTARNFALVCLWCGRTVGRSVGRSVTWLPNFLGWVDLFTHGAPRARFARGAPLLLWSKNAVYDSGVTPK